MWFSARTPVLPQLDDVLELLAGVGRILMEIDDKLDRITELLEED